MLGGGTFDEVLQNHRPDPRAQTYSGVFTHVLASQKPAATALAMHVNFRTFGVVCMHIMDALKHDLGELGLTEEDLGFFGMFAVCYSGDMNLDYNKPNTFARKESASASAAPIYKKRPTLLYWR